ncbi:Alpha-methylacyl-CoA racemase [Manis javanica]|nr:Alpha-methylacyl-CoA racemase [Manis javanica]
MLLADMGAEVLRIARPGTPVDAQDITTRRPAQIEIDLRGEEGQASALALIARADLLIEGFRPGVMERLGLGPEPCLARNPPGLRPHDGLGPGRAACACGGA